MYVCMYVGMYACMYVCMYLSIYACMYVGMYVCIYLYIFLRMYVCMCLHIYIIYTYIIVSLFVIFCVRGLFCSVDPWLCNAQARGPQWVDTVLFPCLCALVRAEADLKNSGGSRPSLLSMQWPIAVADCCSCVENMRILFREGLAMPSRICDPVESGSSYTGM